MFDTSYTNEFVTIKLLGKDVSVFWIACKIIHSPSNDVLYIVCGSTLSGIGTLQINTGSFRIASANPITMDEIILEAKNLVTTSGQLDFT